MRCCWLAQLARAQAETEELKQRQLRIERAKAFDARQAKSQEEGWFSTSALTSVFTSGEVKRTSTKSVTYKDTTGHTNSTHSINPRI